MMKLLENVFFCICRSKLNIKKREKVSNILKNIILTSIFKNLESVGNIAFLTFSKSTLVAPFAYELWRGRYKK